MRRGARSLRRSGSDGYKSRTHPIFDRSGSPEAMPILGAGGQIRASLIPRLLVRIHYNPALLIRLICFVGKRTNASKGMMDQLSSVGCEFLPDALEKVFEANVKYYTNRQLESGIMKRKNSQHMKHKPSGWAAESIYESNQPIRPWGLHGIQSANSFIYDLLGSISRAPGMYKKINPKNGRPLPEFLEDTNERIHPSVRVRLACEGLGLNDREVWDCPSLLKVSIFWSPRFPCCNFVC